MNNSLVSIVMATYNESIEYLEQAIASILNQTYKNIELIIVDDSTDLTIVQYLDKIIEKDTRIKLIRNNSKLGFVKSLNKGLIASSGKYIARMDSDDISMPERILEQVSYMEKNPQVDILGTSIFLMDGKGNITGFRDYKTSFKEIEQIMFFRNPIAHPTVLFRAKLIQTIGLYNEEFRMAEDYEYWMRAVKKGMVIQNLSERLLKYRLIEDYHKKRTYSNWKYNAKAKIVNFNSRYVIRNCIGIILPVILMIMPKFVLKLIYNRERKSSFLY